MNVNQKGDIGVAKVLANLTQQGFTCFLPFSGSSVADLIVANEAMELLRLQVKFRNLENGAIVVGVNTVINGVKTPIDLSKIDGWAIYCPETNEVYYVCRSDVAPQRTRFTLRVREPKQIQPNSAPNSSLFLSPHRLWKQLGDRVE